MFTSKRISKPKFRRKALYFYVGSNAMWIPMSILLGAPFMLISQIVLLGINIRGFLNIRKELK